MTSVTSRAFRPAAADHESAVRRPRLLVRVFEIGRAVPLEHAAPLAAALVLTLMFIYMIVRRLGYPYELEWMTGSVLDHIERVQTGRPVYAAPTAAWIPFMYPPLYYWVAALVMKVVPGAIGARLVSIVSCLIAAYCIWRLARWHGATRWWSLIGVGLFFAAFSYNGFWYDLERVDTLSVALIAVGVAVLCESTGAVGALVSGMLVGLGFFAKQPAVLFAAAGIVALLLRRERNRALVFAGASATVIAGGTIWLHLGTDGWFSYYVIYMPLAHGMQGEYVTQFFVHDLARAFVPTLATVALLVGLARGPRRNTVFACMALAGFLASAMSRLHPGGWDNVLVFWTTFAIAGVAIEGSRADRALADSTLGRAGVGALVVAQFGLWTYDPHSMLPARWQRASVQGFAHKVQALEAADGDVLVTGRGHLTATRHFHIAALMDVVRVEHQLPGDVARSFTERRFGDVVIEGPEELQMAWFPEFDQQLYRVVAANYYVAEVLEPQPPPVAGYAGHPTYILRRRTQTLDSTDLPLLQRRIRLEAMLSMWRMWLQVARVPPPDEPSVEEVALRMDAQPIGDIALP